MTWTSLLFNGMSRSGFTLEFTIVYRKRHCLPNFINELILGQRRLQSFNLVALFSKDVFAGLVDVLEEQNLDVLGVERLQELGGGPPGESRSAKAGGRRMKRSSRGSRETKAGRDFELLSER